MGGLCLVDTDKLALLGSILRSKRISSICWLSRYLSVLSGQIVSKYVLMDLLRHYSAINSMIQSIKKS